MDWTKGYRARYSLRRVDGRTWASGASVNGVKELSVDRSCEDSVPLLESGSAVIDMRAGESFTPGWHRIEMLASQGGDSCLVEVATLWFDREGSHDELGADSASIAGYSVLKPVSDRIVNPGEYAPKGADGARFAADMISECTPAPVMVHGSFILADHIVFNIGATKLEAVWQVLDAGGYCMQIGGDGSIMVMPMPKEPDLILNGRNMGLVVPGIDTEDDFANVPNVVKVFDGEQMFVAVNDDPESPTSTANRPVKERGITSPSREEGETNEAYARRTLDELSSVQTRRSYRREFYPGVLPFSIIRGSSGPLAGDMRCISQALSFGNGISVDETCGTEVRR